LFLTEYSAELASLIIDETWLCKLAYLADIFSLINKLNLSLQGLDSNILRSQDKIAAFKKKLGLWKTRINTSLDMFPTLSDYINNNPSIKADMIICDIGKHLDALSQHFDEYFTNDNFIENFDWIRNPFDVEMSDLAGCELEELAELSCN